MKYFAVGKYYKNLYGHLKTRYGAPDVFTHGQIKRTVEECNFNTKYIPYAYALFLEQDELATALNQEYPDVVAEEVRRYIAKRFFGGNESYTFKETVRSKIVNYANDTIGVGPGGDLTIM